MIAPNLDVIRRGRSRVAFSTGLILVFLSGLAACSPNADSTRASTNAQSQSPATAPDNELYTDAARADLLDAARRVIEADPVATLISVDATGRPRARTVDTAGPGPGDDWRFWVATRPGTRKVEQIKQHPDVTLHFETDDQGSYVSVMGQARIHRDDVALFDRFNPIDADLMPTLFPDYPTDYLLIEIRPVWLEVLSTEAEASIESWRPQSVVFDPGERSQ